MWSLRKHRSCQSLCKAAIERFQAMEEGGAHIVDGIHQLAGVGDEADANNAGGLV